MSNFHLFKEMVNWKSFTDKEKQSTYTNISNWTLACVYCVCMYYVIREYNNYEILHVLLLSVMIFNMLDIIQLLDGRWTFEWCFISK
jgi:hypothetical protein